METNFYKSMIMAMVVHSSFLRNRSVHESEDVSKEEMGVDQRCRCRVQRVNRWVRGFWDFTGKRK